jgi:hypothetical protein
LIAFLFFVPTDWVANYAFTELKELIFVFEPIAYLLAILLACYCCLALLKFVQVVCGLDREGYAALMAILTEIAVLIGVLRAYWSTDHAFGILWALDGVWAGVVAGLVPASIVWHFLARTDYGMPTGPVKG